MESPILVTALGSGGMAEVFLAIRRGMGGFLKLVVVKRLRTNEIEGEAVAMFHDEARISARLNHPNVVQTHEVGFDGEHYRLEMEYLDGQPLHRITHRAKRAGRAISPAVAVAVIQDVLAGLHYAHELKDYDGTPLGIVHRDVSPQNIFMTYDGRVKVVDFGIAKAQGQMAVTQLGMVKGKIRYMAPEQATGQPVDARTDVFATAIVLWQLLVGRGYWGDADEIAIFSRLSSNQLPPGPRSQNPEVPEVLDAILARALAYDPRDRYASAEELRAALEASGVAERNAQASLGALAAELFAEERQKIRAEIEKATARPSPTESSPALPTPKESPPEDATRRLDPSERPVSGNVRIPDRRSRWASVAVAGAMVMGAAGVAFGIVRSKSDPVDVSAVATQPTAEVQVVLPPTTVAAAITATAPAPTTTTVARTEPTSAPRAKAKAESETPGEKKKEKEPEKATDAGSASSSSSKEELRKQLTENPWVDLEPAPSGKGATH